ncbi:MAG TPA: DegT/DnrJ/EryC1/StrS family aminotransferase [Gemmataceae bacterium]|jgi:perosamine synthetase|nr:DegT/DnrJ/EryC1/StrS family aminotransferase [Gemmataceae bacterium]
MQKKTILTAGPSITNREIDYVIDAVTHGWNQNWNSYLVRFEQAFAKAIGTRFALTTSSCTGAMHLALLALGVGPGDEVIVPEITWVATASAVAYCGAKPVFVDVEPDTWCMDMASAAQAITPRTKVIAPVHLYGHPADMVAATALARKHGLKVLEDAAPALGAKVNHKYVGGLSDVAAFSFQGAKLLTTGEGGMLVTSDEALVERMRYLGDHGRDPKDPTQNTAVGFKYKMSNLQAALGLAQLERLDELVEKKRLIFRWYEERLSGLPGVQLNAQRPWARSTYWMSSIVLEEGGGVARDSVMAALKQAGIDSRPFFRPLSSLPMYKSRQGKNPVAYQVAGQGINLPSGHNLAEGDVDYICAMLRETLSSRKRAAA